MKAVNMIVLSALIATAAAQDSDCDGIPTGAWTEASILPANTIPDGNLTKYKSEWILLKSEITGQIPKINRTEAAIGLTEDRKFLLVAMRCFEESMDKLAEKSQFSDREEIFQDDHIEIHLNTPSKNWFLVAVNPAGAIWDESRDLAIIKRDSLPVLWNPGTAAHVSKFADRWEIEVAIPCKDFGRLGPSEKHPWGINLSRTRQVSGKAESFALVPQAGAYPDFLPANEEYIELTQQLGLSAYVSEQTDKFIMGERSLDEFDAFQQELKDRGIERYTKALNDWVDMYK